jgi:hypothetical protein
MNEELVRRLVLYIADQFHNMGTPTPSIRLIKALYMIDLQHYDEYYRTLTGIEWVKYDFGPYFFRWPEIVDGLKPYMQIEDVETKKGNAVVFRSEDRQDIFDIVEYAVKVLIDETLEDLAYEDLDVLLDRVYATLPVKHGAYCQPLDFTLETDHLILEQARVEDQDFVTLDELLAEISDLPDERG